MTDQTEIGGPTPRLSSFLESAPDLPRPAPASRSSASSSSSSSPTTWWCAPDPGVPHPRLPRPERTRPAATPDLPDWYRGILEAASGRAPAPGPDSTAGIDPPGNWTGPSDLERIRISRLGQYVRGVIVALLKEDLPGPAKALELCGTYHMGICSDCKGEVRPMRWRCGVRVCPTCTYIREQAVVDRLAPEIQDIVLCDEEHPEYELQHITITTRKPTPVTREYIHDTYLLLLGSVARPGLIRKIWTDFLKAPGAGALAAAETAPGGMVHVHFVYYGPVVNQVDLVAWWWWRTGAHQCKVQVAHDICDDICKDFVRYVSKEVAHHKKIRPEWAAWTLSAIAGSRRLRTYGAFYNLQEPDEDDDLVDVCPHCGAMPCKLERSTWLDDFEATWLIDKLNPSSNHRYAN